MNTSAAQCEQISSSQPNSSEAPPLQPAYPLLTVKDLGFSYVPKHPIITDFSFTFQPGQTYAITGPSGSGKSTLLYILGLMLTPHRGGVYLGDAEVSQLPDAQRAQLRANHFGFVFQDAALDQHRTVLDNVTESCLYRGVDPAAYTERALSLLARFHVDVPPERKPNQVSGGQAQRIALCRALLGNPRYLLADEPTGNLDPASAAAVMSGLEWQAQRGATVIIVTHSPEITEQCSVHLSL